MLASQRTGAIIAVERDIGLRNYIEGGIPLDATLTSDLLLSIFQPKSPLHDGAVIVQGDRIAAAACFLPLTVNPAISKDFGTRHRAAIGLTEESDAAAIVVSEETGRISLALDGHVERGLDADRLRARLRTLVPLRKAVVGARPGRRRSTDGLQPLPQLRAQGRRRRHRGAAVARRRRREGRRAQPARAARTAEHARRASRSVGDAPSTVDVRVRGSSTTLGQLSAGDVWRCWTVATAKPGRNLFHLTPDHVRVPFGVEVTLRRARRRFRSSSSAQ